MNGLNVFSMCLSGLPHGINAWARSRCDAMKSGSLGCSRVGRRRVCCWSFSAFGFAICQNGMKYVVADAKCMHCANKFTFLF